MVTPLTRNAYTVSVSAVTPKLKLDSSWSDKVILQAGKSQKYKIPYSGYPEPKITWAFSGDTHLPSTVTPTADTAEIVLSLKNVARGDSGIYEVTVSYHLYPVLLPPVSYYIGVACP